MDARAHKQSFTPDSRIAAVRFEDDRLRERGRLIILLLNGMRLAVPLSLYPTLAVASPAARDNWFPSDSSRGIYWPELGEWITGHQIAGLAPRFAVDEGVAVLERGRNYPARTTAIPREIERRA